MSGDDRKDSDYKDDPSEFGRSSGYVRAGDSSRSTGGGPEAATSVAGAGPEARGNNAGSQEEWRGPASVVNSKDEAGTDAADEAAPEADRADDDR